jgi:hypothetical protein
MTEAIEEKLRKERVLLWRARNLHRQFLGDSTWMPCGNVETSEDRFIFEPHQAVASALDNLSGLPAFGDNQKHTRGGSTIGHASLNMTNTEQVAGGQLPEDVHMLDAPQSDVQLNLDTKKSKCEDEKSSGKLLMQPNANTHAEINLNGAESTIHVPNPDQGLKIEKQRLIDAIDSTQDNSVHSGRDIDMENTEEATKNLDGENSGSSPEPPRRMTTRAQTNATVQQQNGIASHPTSNPNDDAEFILYPHPLFLTPDNIRPDPDFGLPPAEAEETRRLLWSYIQKQDETVRGFEYMLQQLLRACRMKDDVLEWCKTEGHVGEMSDGEDWYDREKWGLAPDEDLKKGADEEDAENAVDEGRTTGKRGRGRRQ